MNLFILYLTLILSTFNPSPNTKLTDVVLGIGTIEESGFITIRSQNIGTAKKREIPVKILKEERNLKINSIKSKNKQEWFIKYKEVMNEYKEFLETPESIHDDFSKKEIYLMACVIETECYDADFDSKCNVANVIFNRLDSKQFGDSITEIITSPNQFAYHKKEISESTLLALEYAYVIKDTSEALYFENQRSNVHAKYADYLFTDNIGHKFFK